MKKIALVTGATSGLGAEFARQIANEGNDLVLVARDIERLSTSAKTLGELGVNVEVISADLSTDEGTALVEKRLLSEENPVDLLVNNAGFGIKGAFIGSDIKEHEKLLRVNINAVVRLTHAALEQMAKRKTGGIINVSSIAGLTPSLRPSSTYAASKAFVAAFSEGLSATVAHQGVTLSVVCPGYVKTEFHKRAGHNMAKLPNILWLQAETVVTTTLKEHEAGKFIIVPSARYKVILFLIRTLPEFIKRAISKKLSKGLKN